MQKLVFLFIYNLIQTLALRWPRGWMPPPFPPPPPFPTGFSNFFRKWEELSLQTKLLPVGSSLRHLAIKNFSDLTYRLGSKIIQREGEVKSSNFSRNDATIRILTHFFGQNHSKLPLEDKNWIQ